MVRKKEETYTSKSKKDSSSAPASASTLLAGLNKKESKKGASSDEPKGKSSKSVSSSTKSGPPSRVLKSKAPVRNDYLAGVDLPPSDDEEDEPQPAPSRKKPPVDVEDDDSSDDSSDDDDDEEEALPRLRSSGVVHQVAYHASDRELKKREKKQTVAAMAAEEARKAALRDDDENAFAVTVGSKVGGSTQGDGEGGDLGDNARDLKLENFSVSARGKEIFRNASVTIVSGRRYGLVGPNGKGKSTLMKLIAKRQLPVPKNLDVLLVEQEVVGDDRSALTAVMDADVELVSLREKEARLRAIAEKEESDDVGVDGGVDDVAGDAGGDGEVEKTGGKGKGKKGKGQKGGKGNNVADVAEVVVVDDVADAAEQLALVYERMSLIGAESAEARASKILAGLGFSKEMQSRSTASFSGGWRMRISLARALYVQPTLLLLDEPTNHLDLRAVLWLEEYLMRWKKTLIVVSHDRDFLNSVCTDIIHLHDFKLHMYKGNFDGFEEMYEQKRRENNKKFETYEKQLKAAKKSGSKATQDKVKDKAKQAAQKDVRSKSKKGGGSAADQDDEPKEAPSRWRDYSVEFHFPEPTELTPPLLQLKEVAFKYPGREDFGLKGVDVGIDMGTRVAIVGPNGAGKSTLLNLLAGDLQPTDGESRQSQKLRIGRYSQHFVDLLSFEETPVQYLLRLYPEQEGPSKQEAVRAKLGKFGLPSHNHLTPIVKLSGGQKARVVFTSISMRRPHILLLDEPTNHLDMQSIDALADALDEFTGGVVLVSHDSRLISRVCADEEKSEIWVVENGEVERFPGSFDEYKEDLIKEIIEEVES